MCYFLYIASPLTLSEVRSMLPPGLTADLASSQHRATLQQLHPQTRTVAQLLVGACSCDLVRPRLDDPIEDERELRTRYQRNKLPRDLIIRELERHRRGPLPRPKPPGGWASAIASLVAEHARNAGPTLYLLEFVPHPPRSSPSASRAPVARTVQEIRSGISPWLVEAQPVIVS